MLVTPATLSLKSPRGFIVLDGVNGAGKTTLAAKIIEYLAARSVKVIKTREPGATEIGKTLRSLLLETPPGVKSPLTEIFMFAADRAQHVHEVVRPAIQRGEKVISDRYYYSTLAFQGYGRGLDLATLLHINQIAIDGVYPDFVILLDLDPEEGLRRTQGRGGSATNTRQGNQLAKGSDAFELEDLEFHRRLRNGFLTIAKEREEPFIVVDAKKSPDAIFEEIRPAIEKWCMQ